jgi:tRNA1(Val) A37 N6-methylase TrmN6
MSLRCETCLKEFTSEKRLSTHSSKEPKCVPPKTPVKSVEIHSCVTCLKDFKTKAQRDKHVERKTCKRGILAQNVIVKPIETSFRERSLKMNADLDKTFRQDNGIFFTPKKARDLLFEKLKEYNFTATKILEPSYGTGEFLEDAANIYPEAKLYGVELNEKLYKSYTNPKATLSNGDFLKYRNVKRMDLIIGNPPYFVMEDKDAKNPKCMVGRPNIYIAFLYKCLEEHLADNGYLGFVLPTSLFNCSFYEPMRKYIADNCTVAFVKELDVEYYETNQDTMLIIIKKAPDPEQKYIFKRNGKSYISPYYLELEELVKGTKTLYELNLRVKTGDIVWNNEGAKIKVKGNIIDGPDRLTHDKTGENTFRLIYPSNITTDCKLLFGNKDKKEFIKNFKCPPVDAPAILVNRGFGNASAEYGFVYAFVDTTTVENGKFYAENHLNVITGLDTNAKKLIPVVLKSFRNEKTSQFVKYFNANGSMSKTELENVIPIFM